MVMVVKVVTGNGELKKRVHNSASNKKECIGEKWERMGLKKDLSLPRKLRENYKKVNCRRININMVWQYFRDNTVDFDSGFRLSYACCWGATWRAKRYEEGGDPEEFLCPRKSIEAAPSICGDL